MCWIWVISGQRSLLYFSLVIVTSLLGKVKNTFFVAAQKNSLNMTAMFVTLSKRSEIYLSSYHCCISCFPTVTQYLCTIRNIYNYEKGSTLAPGLNRVKVHLFSLLDFIDTKPKQQRNTYLLLFEYTDPHFFSHHYVRGASFSKTRKISKNLWPALSL